MDGQYETIQTVIDTIPVRDGNTGLTDVPCRVYGNGVEIETVVDSVNDGVNEIRLPDGSERMIFPRKAGAAAGRYDVVKVHFLPETTLAMRANEPELVALEEKDKIALDCLLGFRRMIKDLTDGEVHIENHANGKDFYLYADTNNRFAAFLRMRCGFKGNAGAGQAWVLVSEFCSDENIRLIEKNIAWFKNRVHLDSENLQINRDNAG